MCCEMRDSSPCREGSARDALVPHPAQRGPIRSSSGLRGRTLRCRCGTHIATLEVWFAEQSELNLPHPSLADPNPRPTLTCLTPATTSSMVSMHRVRSCAGVSRIRWSASHDAFWGAPHEAGLANTWNGTPNSGCICVRRSSTRNASSECVHVQLSRRRLLRFTIWRFDDLRLSERWRLARIRSLDSARSDDLPVVFRHPSRHQQRRVIGGRNPD
jgi:hypothetical protein